jgi:hypothetical protein
MREERNSVSPVRNIFGFAPNIFNAVSYSWRAESNIFLSGANKAVLADNIFTAAW